MISNSTIKTLSTKLQTTELNVRREYLQHLFLLHFYQQKQADQCYFKGGTALRIVFDSPRFSEDLDFSITGPSQDKLESSILASLQEIEYEGINTNILESKPTTGGHLAQLQFQLNHQSVEILLQFSTRKARTDGETVTVVNDFIPPYPATILDRNQLINEKLEALLTRAKPRDFYDLYFLLRSNLINRDQKQLLGQVRDKLNSAQINFDMELKQFLPKSHWAIIRDFNSNLNKEIARFV